MPASIADSNPPRGHRGSTPFGIRRRWAAEPWSLLRCAGSRLLRCGLCLALGYGGSAAADSSDLVVILAGRVITVSGEEFAPGRIVIEDGKITGVGRSIEYPPGARIIRAPNETVMPGMVHPRSRHDLPSYRRSGVNGAMRVADELLLDQLRGEDLLAAGFTAICLVPDGTDIPGVAAVIHPAGPPEQRFLTQQSYLRARPEWGSSGKAMLRDALEKAKQEIEKVEKARKEWEQKQKEKQEKNAKQKPKEEPSGDDEKPEQPPKPKPKSRVDRDNPSPEERPEERPEEDQPAKEGPQAGAPAAKEETFEPPKIDPDYQPLVDLIQKKDGAKLLVELLGASDWLHLQDVLKPYADLRHAVFLDTTLVADFHHVSKAMGQAPTEVVLIPQLHYLPDTTFRYNLMQELAAQGSIVSAATRWRSNRDEYQGLRTQLASLIRAGLSRETALKSITLNPANLLGIGQRVGSIERGKEADLIFLDGDPFDPQSRVTRVMILGEFVWRSPTPLDQQDQQKRPSPVARGASKAKKQAKQDRPEEQSASSAQKSEPRKADRYFAVVNAEVHTVTQDTIDRATILSKNGKIFRIGPQVPLPEDTEVLDVAGRQVYPGLIAAATGNVLGSGRPEDNTDVYSLRMMLALAGGVTTMISGNTAAKLTWGSTEDIVIKRDLFQTLRYSSKVPDQRRKVREGLEKVRQYLRELEAHQLRKKEDPNAKPPDKEWLKGEYSKYLKLLQGETVLRVRATRAHDILEICELARQYNLRVVLDDVREGWTVAPQMARAGVAAIITPRSQLPRDETLNRPTGSSIENAAILHRHGILLAVVPLSPSIDLVGLAGRNLMQLNMEAAFAVRGGLPNDAALRTITIDAAKIMGIDHRVGSLEIGKDADFIVVDGDPLHYLTLVHWTIVNGRVVYAKDQETLFDHIRPQGELESPPPEDYWPRQLIPFGQ